MHRRKLIRQLFVMYQARRNVLLVGPAGIGKTTILREVHKNLPLQICEETTSLGSICDSLEAQLGWRHGKLSVVERKNRLLKYLEERGEAIALDHVAETPPRVARFIANLAQHIPVWIAARSTQRREIGHVWEYLYNFTRIDVPPFSLAETSALIRNAAASRTIQPDACQHCAEIHRISKGVPGFVAGLLSELGARDYKITRPFGFRLLELDRQIRELTSSSKQGGRSANISNWRCCAIQTLQ
jgi:predicted ATPase